MTTTANIAPAAGRRGPPGVGIQGPPGIPDLRARSISAPVLVNTYTFDYDREDVLYVNTPAGTTQTVVLTAAGASTRNTPIHIKRTDTNPSSVLKVTSLGSGIDGAVGNTITLGLSTALGINSGDSVTLLYDDDAGVWRVLN